MSSAQRYNAVVPIVMMTIPHLRKVCLANPTVGRVSTVYLNEGNVDYNVIVNVDDGIDGGDGHCGSF